MNNEQLIETLRKMLKSNCVTGIPAMILVEIAIDRIQELEKQLNEAKAAK
jgi:hypothetical protein